MTLKNIVEFSRCKSFWDLCDEEEGYNKCEYLVQDVEKECVHDTVLSRWYTNSEDADSDGIRSRDVGKEECQHSDDETVTLPVESR